MYIVLFLSQNKRGGEKMDIYIRPFEKNTIICRKEIFLKDLCDIGCVDYDCNDLKNLLICRIKEDGDDYFLISTLDIICAIRSYNRDFVVHNVGEKEILIRYLKDGIKPRGLSTFLKVVFVCSILFAGSATALMAFHNETMLPGALNEYYKIFFGHSADNHYIISVPYSFGIGVGIIVFFNHFLGKKITDDPTPIEIEMSKYESDADNAEKDVLNSESRVK